MSRLLLNGQDIDLPVLPDTLLKDLLEVLRKQVTTEQTLVSAVRVNGVELTHSNEETFGMIPVSDLQTVEVCTSYSRELIDDTLQHLLDYSAFLDHLSQRTARFVGEPEFHASFQELLDGMKTFEEGISSIVLMLRISDRSKIVNAETNLLELVSGLLAAYQNRDEGGLRKILAEQLPQNLEIWRNTGIPYLVHFSSS